MAEKQPDPAAEAEAAEKARWDNFVKWHEENGYEVQGDGFHNCIVVGVEEGPTYDETPGA